MAETLSPSGIVIPQQMEPISGAGVAEMRTLGATANTAFSAARFDRGRIPNGTDVFTLDSGSWTVSSAGFAETMTNLPEAWPGRFTIENGGEPIVKAAQFRPYDRDYHWETVRAIGGTWMPWRKVGKSEHPAYAPNAIRQAQMIHHYGPVDTGGRGAVAWRIDHGLANFKTKMLPIFRAAGIVPMITLNSRSWDRSENDGVTQAEVNQWVADGWVEISNHGATHSNAQGDAEIESYVAEGLAELEQQLPAAKGHIYGFHIAGVGVQGAFGGFQGGDTPERWDTVMGRAILTHHAFGSGYVPGTNLRVLDGQIRQGLYHTGTDTAEVSTITGLIDQAIATRRGLQIMSHPSNMDTDGYHSTADIQAIVDHIVAQRDAGDLAVLSPYQLMVADSTRTAPSIDDVEGLRDALDEGTSVEAIELGTEDLNSVTEPGSYYQTQSHEATPETNYPALQAGSLVVSANSSRSQVQQTYTTFLTSNPERFWRTFYSNTWSAWRKVLDDTRIAPLEQDTGDRNITALVPGVSEGHWTIRRVGGWVYMNLYDLGVEATAGDYWQQTGFLPVGFRPPAPSQYVHFPCAQRTPTGFTPGPFRVDRYGGITIYGVTGKLVAVTATWPTNDAFPRTLPGDPA